MYCEVITKTHGNENYYATKTFLIKENFTNIRISSIIEHTLNFPAANYVEKVDIIPTGTCK